MTGRARGSRLGAHGRSAGVLDARPWAFSLICAAALAVACGGSGDAPRFLSIATGGTGGVYYPYGGALAKLITEHIAGVQATAEVTNASADNLKLLQLGKVDLAFTLADTLAEAVTGRGAFRETGAIGTVRTLAVLYTNYTHVVARQGLTIQRIVDLRGRTVSTGSPGSGTELIADRVLAAAGLDPRRDITRHALGVAESAGALKDGKVDAFFWSGGVPTPSIQDLAATPGLSIALLGQAHLLPTLQREYGGELYRLATIPSGSYRGVDGDVQTIGVTNLLVASSALDDDVVHDIVRLMFEHKNALVAAHPEARHLSLPPSPDAAPAPFHSGAERYYREHAWK
jgi:TRAP transporter TAXI family solute receptor